ncbi:MAG: tRNA lysidine(34) synthetase TilS [Treponema sp.]
MNDEQFVKKIDCRIKKELLETGFSFDDTLCIGVSGGADSICLLTSLISFFKENSSRTLKELYVVSVNHRIRPESESLGDCLYVEEYCKSFSVPGVKINFSVLPLEEGEVFSLAEKRRRGTEEAARFLRYKAFENYCVQLAETFEKNSEQKKSKKIFFALAHNRNDQLETLIMRFLQGAGGSSRTGIAEKRTVNLQGISINYVRPLMNVERSEIERYLKIKNVHWRTDSTNNENNYLRNKIRNEIIPVFDRTYPGWKTALLSGREKAVFENDFIEKKSAEYEWHKTDDGVFIEKEIFYSADDVIRERLVYKALELMKIERRIPFAFVKQAMFCNGKIEQNGIEVFADEKNLFIKKIKNEATISGFFAIIEKECCLEFDFGTLFARLSEKDAGFMEIQFVTNDEQIHYLSKIQFPFCFRSRQMNDYVLTKDKGKKSLSDVLSDFKVEEKRKNLIPVIQSLDGDRKILAVWGSIFGYQNWIV